MKQQIRVLLAAGPIVALFYLIKRCYWWLSYKTAKADDSAPKVTIVIPVYNVEKFLADCLRSARAQRWPNLELIAVNDGATDGSAAILSSFAANTPELRVVTQHNQGLGAARNAGIDAIEDTDYLMFLDSDDLLPAGAVARFVHQAQSSGSPLVVGKTVCFYGARYFDRTSTAAFFKRNETAITLNQKPELLGDATSWNKLYNFDFWREHKLKFPVGVSYEDMTLVATAYLAAKQIDVLKAPAYFWRVRAEGESLSKRTSELKSLQDRLLSIEQITRLLKLAINKGIIERAVFESYLSRVISMDLQLFAPAFAETDEEFFDEFKSRASKILAEATDEIWAKATGKHRKVIWAAIHSTREQAIKQLES